MKLNRHDETKGSSLVEGIFAIPLLLMMALAFVDLSHWTIQKIHLWNLARHSVRHISLSSPRSEHDWEMWMLAELARSHIDGEAEVHFVPLQNQPLIHPFRRNKRLTAIELTLRIPLVAHWPLMRWVFNRQNLKMEVHVYDVQMEPSPRV